MKPTITGLEARLQEQLLLARAVPGDRLMLADATLLQALDGSRPLTPAERTALQASPLTLKRFRQLALQRHHAAQPGHATGWNGSQGLLRAAATATALETLRTQDGYWTLDFVPSEQGWRVILALCADAPFAALAVQQGWRVQVHDGAGQLMLQGALDDDGECEAAWPHAAAPASYLQQHGASFVVTPAGQR
ncbi:hypothetical protein ACFFKC_10065 [Pseudoduganella danionis]|uniref:hypothetical protein n=1 Tax=Pseudoduganella danionis TaxID=1890295 RepID=UPI003530BAEC